MQSKTNRLITKEITVFSVIREVLGKDLSPIDRALLIREGDYENFTLAIPQDFQVLKTLKFFEQNKSQFRFIQNGTFVIFDKLDKSNSFVAYTKENVGYCPVHFKPVRELLAYKPED